jgi:hypothetical protein
MSDIAVAGSGDEALTCYRHPDRETLVRCGRCDQPICTGCSMQGPVGWRCKECGKPPRDLLTILTPRQLALGLVVALGAGTLAALAGMRVGFFLSLCIGPVIGAFIAEGVMRATGYKRGIWPLALVLLGIMGGVLIAAGVNYMTYTSGVPAEVAESGFATSLIMTDLTSAIVYVAAASIGAYARLARLR